MAKKVKLEKIAVEVTVLITTIEDGKLAVAMQKRSEAPLKGKYEFLSTNVGKAENTDDAAKRFAKEVTGLKKIEIAQLGAYGNVKRKADERTISIAYIAFVPMNVVDAKEIGVEFVSVDSILKSKNIAFDHKDMAKDLESRLAGEVTYSDVAFNFVEEEFTIPNLQLAYEVLLGKKLYKTNFRRMIMDKLEITNYQMAGSAHRPSRLYTKKK